MIKRMTYTERQEHIRTLFEENFPDGDENLYRAFKRGYENGAADGIEIAMQTEREWNGS